MTTSQTKATFKWADEPFERPPATLPEPTPRRYPLPDRATGFRNRRTEALPYESAAIDSMSLGEVRRCMNQIRRAGDKIRPEHLLFNGWSAGNFALAYLIGHHKRRVAGYASTQTKIDDTIGDDDFDDLDDTPPRI